MRNEDDTRYFKKFTNKIETIHEGNDETIRNEENFNNTLNNERDDTRQKELCNTQRNERDDTRQKELYHMRRNERDDTRQKELSNT